MRKLLAALGLLGGFWASNVAATILSYNIDVTSNNWSPQVNPYGVGEQPTFKGTLEVNNALSGNAALVSFNMVTGSQTWTKSLVDSTTFGFGAQFMFDSGGNLTQWALPFKASSGEMLIASNNVMVLTEIVPGVAPYGPERLTIGCNGCVSFAPTSPPPAPIGAFTSYRQNPLVDYVTGGYAAFFNGTNFVIDVDIGLIGDPLPDEVRQIWERGIEEFWGNQVTISDGVGVYPLLVDVSFLDRALYPDYTLRVKNEYCQSFVATISEWCLLPMTDNTGQPNLNMRDEVAIHEFGHMLGLYDEYTGGGVDPNVNPDDLCRPQTFLGVPIPGPMTGNLCHSMMADFGPIQERYFDDLITYFEGVTGRDLTFGFSPLFNTYALTDPGPNFTGIAEPQTVSEPGILWILAAAIPMLAISRRRKQ